MRAYRRLLAFIGRPRTTLHCKSAVDNEGLAGGEGALVGGEVDGDRGDLLWLAEPAHRLAVDEGLAHAIDRLAARLAQRVDAPVERWALDRAGADGVAAYALGDVIGRNRLGQADHRRLRGAVDVAVGDAAPRGGARGDVDDRAPALLQHARQKGADHAMHRLDVEVEREFPVGVGSGEDRAMMDEARAVEEDVDWPDLPRQRLDRLVRADVELALVGIEPFETGDVDIRRNDARALAGEGLGRAAADAGRRRRQQSNLTRQSSGHWARSFRFVFSRGPASGRAAFLGDIAARS